MTEAIVSCFIEILVVVAVLEATDWDFAYRGFGPDAEVLFARAASLLTSWLLPLHRIWSFVLWNG
jgi:hypothetical protein